jgi:hypothetical protein
MLSSKKKSGIVPECSFIGTKLEVWFTFVHLQGIRSDGGKRVEHCENTQSRTLRVTGRYARTCFMIITQCQWIPHLEGQPTKARAKSSAQRRTNSGFPSADERSPLTNRLIAFFTMRLPSLIVSLVNLRGLSPIICPRRSCSPLLGFWLSFWFGISESYSEVKLTQLHLWIAP